MSILHNIFFFIVAIGLLVTFHEFGHFWVARRMGVRVLKFSVGFGKALWSRTGRDGTLITGDLRVCAGGRCAQNTDTTIDYGCR